MVLLAPITRIDASHDPTNDLKFLEQTFEGQDWRASLAYPDHSDNSLKLMSRDKSHLEEKGYLTSQHIAKDGKLILLVHHLGKDTSPAKIMQELGKWRASKALIGHPGVLLNAAGRSIGSVVHWADGVIHDPVKTDGVVNTVAEIALNIAPFFNQDSRLQAHQTVGEQLRTKARALKEPKNILHQFSALFFLGQSIVYAFFAKTNDEISLKQIDQKLTRIKNIEGDIADVQFDSRFDSEHQNAFLDNFRFVKKYPVQVGAVLNDIGMMMYAGHAILENKWQRRRLQGVDLNAVSTDASIKAAKKYAYGINDDKLDKHGNPTKGIVGFHLDLFSTLASFGAWSSYLLPRKERTGQQIEEHANNPFASAWDKYRANPQHVAGGLMLLSSGSRIITSGIKGNSLQKFGESIYTVGDVAMLFTKNDEYGGKKTKDLDKLAAKMADHINAIPHVFGPEAEKRFVLNIAEYLKHKAIDDAGKDPEKKLKLSLAELDERRDHLARVLIQKVQGDNRFESLAYKLAELSNLFPESERDLVRQHLASSMEQLTWLECSTQELTQAISNAAIAKRPDATTEREPLTSDALGKHITDILALAPEVNKGATALAIKHAVDGFMPGTQATQSKPARAQHDNSSPRTTISHATSQPMQLTHRQATL